MNRTVLTLLSAVCSAASVFAQMGNMNAQFTKDVRADLAEKLPKLPSPRRSCSLFYAHLRRDAAMGRSHEVSREAKTDAALVCRSSSWTFLQ